MTGKPEQTALYRIWGESDLLLYIGVSNDFGTRWKQHAKHQPWWDEMRRLTADELFDDRDDAEDAEKAAIKAEKPKYNKRHLVPVEYKSRKLKAIAPAESSAAVTPPVVTEAPPAPRRQNDEPCKVPYPYSLLSFALPGHSMGVIDLSTPDGRVHAAEAFGAYEKQALEFRSSLERSAAEALQMERDPQLRWAIPALHKIRQNYMTLIGDGSSLATGTDVLPVADILRETEMLQRKLAAAMSAAAEALEAIDALHGSAA